MFEKKIHVKFKKKKISIFKSYAVRQCLFIGLITETKEKG